MRLFINEPIVVHTVCYYWKNYYRKLFKRYAIYNKESYSKGVLDGIPDKLFNITTFTIDAQKIVLSEHHMEKFLDIIDQEELTPYSFKLRRSSYETYYMEVEKYTKRFEIVQ
jgi:hypothetical protein